MQRLYWALAIWALAALSGVFAIVSPAEALDCRAAADPISKAICASPDLLKADAALAQTYTSALRPLKGARRDLLIASQRQWLAERQENCTTDMATCIAQSMTDRQPVIAVCFGAAALPQSTAAVTSCPYFIHRGCPVAEGTGSPGLAAYPFLVERLTTALKQELGDFDCEASADVDPSQNNVGEDDAIIAERPGLVCLRATADAYYTGAAHPISSETLDCYDSTAKKKLAFATVFPDMGKGTPALEKLLSLVAGHLEASCCDEDAAKAQDFSDLGLEPGPPSGWSVTDEGDLVVAFDYPAMGRDFLATATVPRAEIIDAVAKPYQRFFVPAVK